MHCIKCGRKTQQEHVFCELCLEDSQRYPVKPGTPIQLPPRPQDLQVKKNPRKKKPEVKPEVQIARLRKSVRWLSLALVATLLAFALAVFAIMQLLDQRDAEIESRIGQNYTVVTE